MKYYRVCRVRCKRCGDVLEHVNKTKDESAVRALYCSCGSVGLDPAAVMYRILGSPFDSEDLSEEWDEKSQLRASFPQERTAVRSKRFKDFTDGGVIESETQDVSEISKVCTVAKAYKRDKALPEKLNETYLFLTAHVTGRDVGERCLRYDFTMPEGVLENLTCYMCNLPVRVNDNATLLFSVEDVFIAESEKRSRYLLHRSCADKFCRDEQNDFEN